MKRGIEINNDEVLDVMNTIYEINNIGKKYEVEGKQRNERYRCNKCGREYFEVIDYCVDCCEKSIEKDIFILKYVYHKGHWDECMGIPEFRKSRHIVEFNIDEAMLRSYIETIYVLYKMQWFIKKIMKCLRIKKYKFYMRKVKNREKWYRNVLEVHVADHDYKNTKNQNAGLWQWSHSPKIVKKNNAFSTEYVSLVRYHKMVTYKASGINVFQRDFNTMKYYMQSKKYRKCVGKSAKMFVYGRIFKML